MKEKIATGSNMSRIGTAAGLPAFLAMASITLVDCSPSSPPIDLPPSTAADVQGPFADMSSAWGLTRPHTGGGLEKRYIVEAKGGGAALLDAEGDGDLDIYWVNGARLEEPERGGKNALYRNDGETGFTDVAAALGVPGYGWGMGALSADYDNDGDADLYVTCLRQNILYRNDGRGGFADVTAHAGVEAPEWSTGAAMGDFDLDGDLDLYVANYVDFELETTRPLGAQWKGRDVFVGPASLPAVPDLFYRNNGDGTFNDITAASGLGRGDPGYGLGVLFADITSDGDADLYIANDSTPNFLYSNSGDGTFTDIGLRANAAFNEMGLPQAGMGVALGDYDNDGAVDLFVSNFEDDYNTLYRNGGDGTFKDMSFTVGLARPSLPFVGFGTVFLDYDNDADLDLYVANGHVYPQIESAGSAAAYGQANHLYDNDGGQFTLVWPAEESARTGAVSRGAVGGDFDDDGRLDLFVTNLNEPPTLLRNVAGQHNWLGLRLVGATANRQGVGARVNLWSGGRRQRRDVLCGGSFLSSGDRRLHFGLGEATAVDSLHVHWPGGILQRVTGLPINAYSVVEQGL